MAQSVNTLYKTLGVICFFRKCTFQKSLTAFVTCVVSGAERS